MANLPANLNYTDKDFASLRARLINLIGSVFTDWTDFEIASFGNILLEANAFVGDVLAFYQDNQADEAFLPFVQLRRNALALAQQLGYEPAGAAAATVDELFTLSAIPTNDVIIPAGTVCKTRRIGEVVEFQLLSDLTILALADPPQAFGTIENSSPAQDIFASDNLANQEFELSATPYLDGSADVVAGNGAYTEVDNFLDSVSTDRHYTITVDENDRALVRFGNGINGEVPTGTITIDYKTGGGAVGNVEPNTITEIVGSFTDVLANPVQVSVNNPDKATGGADRETVAQIRQNAPASLRVLNRTVALEDYIIGAEQVPGVARALMLTSDQTPGIPENRGFLYVVPDGGGTPTTVLKDAVIQAVTVTKPNTVTFKVTAEDPLYLVVDISMVVFFNSGFSPANGAAEIQQILDDYFAISLADGTKNPLIDFGFNYKDVNGLPAGEIPLSDLLCAVRDADSVRKVGDEASNFVVNGSHADLAIKLFEFPVLGTVTITDGDTGLQVV